MVRCLYEALEVERDADESAIRIAYRKAALKWHPDKNQHQLEEAEEKFKEIQNAYEVLSDKHERAWYDSHRDAILRSGERHQAGGGATPGEMDRPEDMDLYSFFTSTAYSGYGDGPRGFYAVYAAVFASLGKKEQESSKQTGRSYPVFGNSSSTWQDVNRFYNEWSGFTTRRDFSWADQYDPRQAPNRKVRRLIENENEKARKSARREFNEQVRELVAFVKKRDKRVMAHAAEEATRRAERAAKEAARRAQEQAERLARAQQYKEAAWVTEQGSEPGSDEDDGYRGEQQLEFYCIVCEKHFKSQNAQENHERSKKHKEQVELLRAVMEDDELRLLDDSNDELELQEKDGASDSELSTSANNAVPQSRDVAGTGLSAASDEEEEEAASSSSDSSSEEVATSTSDVSEESEEEDDEAMLERMLTAQRKKSRQKNDRRGAGEAATSMRSLSLDDSDESSSSGSPVPQGVSSKARNPRQQQAASSSPLIKEEEEGALEAEPKAPKLSAKQKRRERQKRAQGARKSNSNEPVCQICGAEFSSRTQLFKHITATGHAALK